MRSLARILANNIPQVRVDFYVINGKIYFGEMTFFHNSGIFSITPSDWDLKIGDLLVLPDKKKLYSINNGKYNPIKFMIYNAWQWLWS